MHAAADRSADRAPQRTRGYRAVFGEQCPIGQIDPGCVIADGAAVQELPRLAIGIDGPTADNPGIEEIQPFFTRPVDLPVLLADQHGLTLVDRDQWRADLDLERHDVSLLRDADLPVRASNAGSNC